MTAEQAATRQADHENLIRELVDALSAIVRAEDARRWGVFGAAVSPSEWDAARAALAKAKEQGYA